VHNFLELRKDCRVFDLKQACYSAAAALQMAKSHVASRPDSKVLVIGSDIIKYSPGTSGEATQGGGAVAFTVSKNPRILEVEPYSGVHTEDVMDFWRPTYLKEAQFDGKLSAHNYLKSLDVCVKIYLEKANRTIFDIDHVCFHAPFGKMAQKANNHLFKCKSINETLAYNSIIGNSCSASLFICFISLLDNFPTSLAGRRIGFYSYGSGSVAEFFSGVVAEGYQEMLRVENNRIMLSGRHEISFLEYELLCGDKLQDFYCYENIGDATLYGIKNDKRMYKCAT
jgi:hydroxymethylglutaryl-CoA synthase